MMRSLIAIAALVLLASCAETPSKPTTSGGSSSGSGKIVTATPEESFECDDDLILEPHLPEECIPPEPLEPVKPVEPPEPDPIVGTYRVFYTDAMQGHQALLRVYPDNKAALGGASRSWKWAYENGAYRFFWRLNTSKPWLFKFSVKQQLIAGEPDLMTIATAKSAYTSGNFEAIKLSSDPDLLLDHYVLGSFSGPGYKKDFHCINVGRKERTFQRQTGYNASFPISYSYFADSLDDCEAQCRAIIVADYGSIGDRTCPQDRK